MSSLPFPPPCCCVVGLRDIHLLYFPAVTSPKMFLKIPPLLVDRLPLLSTATVFVHVIAHNDPEETVVI